jgi:pyridinium-3,5-bisthiocarboxylic acid mononucleotide nickel chelatase
VGKTLYFDCFSGASGDMVLGALLDLGLPLEGLRAALGSLAIDHGTIAARKVLRAGIAATKFALVGPESAVPLSMAVDAHARAHAHGHAHPHSHRNEQVQPSDAGGHHSLREIADYIDRSALSAAGRRRAKALFERLAEAEAAVHAIPVEQVHLHEVGAVDSIVDIVGAVYGLEWLGATRIVSSPLNVGSGTVRCAHGILPVPAPATSRLLTGVPIYARGVPTELTTPTGALLVTAYAESFGGLPAMRVTQVGYGAGDKDFADHPNVLRLMVGDEAGNGAIERIVSIECEIDDMNPQLFGPLMDRLYGAGALDVYYAAVQMKKNRPGTLVTVLAMPDRRDALSGVLFADTTTIGVRYVEMDRERLQREVRSIATPVGPIRVKVATRDGRIMNASPEFEDCARAAAASGLPIKDVQAIATKAWLERDRAAESAD